MDLKCASVFAILGCLNLLFYIDTEVESNFIEAARKTWNQYPILDVSFAPVDGYEPYVLFDQEEIDPFCDCLHVEKYKKLSSGHCGDEQMKDGCFEYKQNKAYIYNKKILYVKYYKADYYELFSRLHHTDPDLCNTGYSRCGYLDIFKNRFCVLEGEKCPITSISIESETSSNKGYELPIVNRLYVSENDRATILDINKIYTQKDLDNFKLSETSLYFELSDTSSTTIKSDFLSQNKLVIGTMPSKFDYTYFHLYNLIYPGNLKDYSLNSFYVGLIHKRFAVLFPLLLVKIAFGVLLWILDEKNNIQKKWFCMIIILTSCYIILEIFSILFFIGRFYLDNILSYYKEHKIYVTEEDWRNGHAILVFELIFALIDIGYIIQGVYMIFYFKNKIQEEGNENLLQPIAINN